MEGWVHLWTLWYAHWSAMTWAEHVGSALAGALGATLYGFWVSPVVKAPRWNPKTGELEANSLRYLVIGAIFAVIVDSGAVHAIVAGALAMPIFTLVIKRILPRLADMASVALTPRGAGGVDSGVDNEGSKG